MSQRSDRLGIKQTPRRDTPKSERGRLAIRQAPPLGREFWPGATPRPRKGRRV